MSEIHINEINDEIRPEEVVPGSANDPFSVNYDPNSTGVTPTSPVEIPSRGAEPVVPAEGTKIVPQTPGAASTPAAPATTPQTPATPVAAPAEKAPEVKAEPVDVEAVVRKAVEETRRAVQSSYDKRLAAIETERQAEREAAIKAQRESKLSSEDLTDDEKDILKQKWELDDQKAELDSYNKELDTYYAQMFVATLVNDYKQFGVTAEALEAFDDPDEMEAFAKDQELNFYRNGGTAAAVIPSTAPVSTSEPDPKAPAGASAPTDLGGQAVSAPPVVLSREANSYAFRDNLNKLPWESLPMPNV